ncbi:hypothetical protein P280DRAFT_548320 [Massarina eburnea CBS 473.64]|uniref:Uncharacterized protein n=1 Tax=Massarina eburnea CBS 473.64 TaxID=1395130 RepID=A0A6A6S2A1_9PLEO|nr:hypothetical protein P280DRAFT_548320 [Massarina eburnea CBS 473.64]
MDDRTGARFAHDNRTTVPAESIYRLPRGLDLSSADLSAPPIPTKNLQDARSVKLKGTADGGNCLSPRISLAPLSNPGYWIAHKTSKRNRLQLHQDAPADLHHSTCLNVNSTGTCTDETDLWILPDFDEWEVEADVSQPETARRKTGEWAPLVERAVSSNRERLRRRLEGDGWDFVCGRYGEDGKPLKELADASEEGVDEEFDVVVLSMVQVSC